MRPVGRGERSVKVWRASLSPISGKWGRYFLIFTEERWSKVCIEAGRSSRQIGSSRTVPSWGVSTRYSAMLKNAMLNKLG